MIKADTLGSLEALVHEFQKDEVPIRKAEVGDISHRDAVEASRLLRVEDKLGTLEKGKLAHLRGHWEESNTFLNKQYGYRRKDNSN